MSTRLDRAPQPDSLAALTSDESKQVFHQLANSPLLKSSSAPVENKQKTAISGLSEHINSAQAFLAPFLRSDKPSLFTSNGEEKLIDPQIFTESPVEVTHSDEPTETPTPEETQTYSEMPPASEKTPTESEEKKGFWGRLKGSLEKRREDDATESTKPGQGANFDEPEEHEEVFETEELDLASAEKFRKALPKWQQTNPNAPKGEPKKPIAAKSKSASKPANKKSASGFKKLEYPYTTTGMIREVTAEDIRSHQADSFFQHFDHDSNPPTSPLPRVTRTDDDITGNDVKIKSDSSAGKRVNPFAFFSILLSIILVVGLIVSVMVLIKPLGQKDGQELRAHYASQAKTPTHIDKSGAVPIEKVEIISNDVDQNSNQAKFLFDGDVKTAWTSKSYRTPNLEKLDLKPIGFRIELKKPTKLKNLEIYSSAAGGKFQVYLDAPATVPDGTPVKEGSFKSPLTVVDLDGNTEVSSVVVIIRNLPVDHSSRTRAYINEVVLH